MSERCEKCNGVKSGCKDTGDKFCDCNEPARGMIEVALVRRDPIELHTVQIAATCFGTKWVNIKAIKHPNEAARKLLAPPVPDALIKVAMLFSDVMWPTWSRKDKWVKYEDSQQKEMLEFARVAQAHADKQTAAELRKLYEKRDDTAPEIMRWAMANRLAELEGESK